MHLFVCSSPDNLHVGFHLMEIRINIEIIVSLLFSGGPKGDGEITNSLAIPIALSAAPDAR